MRLVLLTGSECRHHFVAASLQEISDDCRVFMEASIESSSSHFTKRKNFENQILSISNELKLNLNPCSTYVDRGQINIDEALVKKINEFCPDFFFFYWKIKVKAN